VVASLAEEGEDAGAEGGGEGEEVGGIRGERGEVEATGRREWEGGREGAVGIEGEDVEKILEAVEAGGLGGVVIGANEEDWSTHCEAREGGVEASGDDEAGCGEAAEERFGRAEAEEVGGEAKPGGAGSLANWLDG